MKTKLAIAVALTLACGAAWSADEGFYVGASIGMSDVTAHYSAKESDSIDGTYYKDKVDFSGSDFAWNIYVGYDFNKYLAAEFGYMDLGSPSDQVDKGSVEGGTYKQTAEVKLNGIDLAVVGKVPLGESWDVHARLGLIWWTPEETLTTNVKFTDNTTYKDVYKEKADGTDLLFGIGGSWKMNENIIFGLDWTHIEYSGGGFSDAPPIDLTDVYSVSATYKF